MHRGRLALALAVLGSQAVWADLTIRYQFEVTVGSAFPAAAADALKAQIANTLPAEIATRVKASKCATSVGAIKAIMDSGKGEITLFDPATKRFAAVPEATYMDRVLAQREVPAAAQQALQTALQNLKIDVQTKKTGETGTIQGIQTEDNLFVLSMEIPNPTGVPIGVRLEMHQWLATPEELTRVPALKEIAGCSAGLGASADPSAIIEKMLGPLAGANGLSEAMKELATVKGRFALKTQVDVFAPGIVAMLQAQGGQGIPANVDLNAPLMQLAFNLAELSTSSLPDAAFQIPAGYQEAPLEELLKGSSKPGIAQVQPSKPQVPVAAATAPAIIDFNGTAYRAGGGVSNPVALSKPEPKYTKEARQAKIEGSVLLSLVVDENGVARNIMVVQSLDPGLDQAAIDSVRKWKFKPGQKDGSPVAVMVQIQVTFRLI